MAESDPLVTQMTSLGGLLPMSHLRVKDPNELTSSLPLLNIELHYSAPPMGK